MKKKTLFFVSPSFFLLPRFLNVRVKELSVVKGSPVGREGVCGRGLVGGRGRVCGAEDRGGGLEEEETEGEMFLF